MPTSRCWSRCTAPHKETHNMTINQWTIWLFTVPRQPVYWGKQLTFIETFNWTWILLRAHAQTHTHKQPHHKHNNIGRIDLQTCLFHRNTCSNQIHNKQIANKMHFNVYDVFYALSSHQYVHGDTSIITRLQRYKRCVVIDTPSQLKIIIISVESV